MPKGKKADVPTIDAFRRKAKENVEMAYRVDSINTDAAVANTLVAMELLISATLVEHGLLTMEEALAPTKTKE